MSTTTNYPESPEGSSPTNCPHCGARREVLTFECGTKMGMDSGKFCQSDLCRERAAHAETMKQLAAAQAEVDLCRENLKTILEVGGSIRCREGGGPEDLNASIALTVARLRSDLTAARQKAEAELADTWKQEEDWHRWAREVLSDWATPFDDHKAGLRLGITQLLKLKSNQLAETRRKLEEAEKALDYYKSAFMRQKPRWIPARVRVFKEVRADYPVADAYEPIHAGKLSAEATVWERFLW